MLAEPFMPESEVFCSWLKSPMTKFAGQPTSLLVSHASFTAVELALVLSPWLTTISESNFSSQGTFPFGADIRATYHKGVLDAGTIGLTDDSCVGGLGAA